MRLSTVLTPVSDENLQLAAQCGVTDLVHRYPGPDPAVLRQGMRRAEAFGLRVSVVEGYLPIENLKLGCDDGTGLEAMRRLIGQMSDLGIPLLCYNFMAGTDWARTRLDAPQRGGAKVTAFRLADVEKAVLLGHRPTDEAHETLARGLDQARLWENLDRMLTALLPVAEKHGVTMAMHPDDPPLASLLGKPRIMHSVEAFDELTRRYDSPMSKICFCQGTFAAMGGRHPRDDPAVWASDRVCPFQGCRRGGGIFRRDVPRQRADRHGGGDAGLSRNRFRRTDPSGPCSPDGR